LLWKKGEKKGKIKACKWPTPLEEKKKGGTWRPLPRRSESEKRKKRKKRGIVSFKLKREGRRKGRGRGEVRQES